MVHYSFFFFEYFVAMFCFVERIEFREFACTCRTGVASVCGRSISRRKLYDTRHDHSQRSSKSTHNFPGMWWNWVSFKLFDLSRMSTRMSTHRSHVLQIHTNAISSYVVTSGLRAAGYEYVHIDDCWVGSRNRTTSILQPDYERFPRGMKHVRPTNSQQPFSWVIVFQDETIWFWTWDHRNIRESLNWKKSMLAPEMSDFDIKTSLMQWYIFVVEWILQCMSSVHTGKLIQREWNSNQKN